MAYIGNTARLCQDIVDGELEHVEDWLVFSFLRSFEILMLATDILKGCQGKTQTRIHATTPEERHSIWRF